MGEGVPFDNVYVSSGNSAAGVYIVPKVAACDRLESLCLTQIRVAR